MLVEDNDPPILNSVDRGWRWHALTALTLVTVKITVIWRPFPKVTVFELEMSMVGDVTREPQASL